MAEILDEINEELRQERLQNFWKENGNFIIVTVILVILTVGGKAFWTDYKAERDAERTGDLASVIEQDMKAGNTDALAAYVQDAKGSHKMSAEFLLAADEKTDPAAAADRYRAIAANGDYPDVYRDMAALLAVGKAAEGGVSETASLIGELNPLIDSDSAFKASALELRAFLHASDNDYDAAMKDIDTIMAMDDERAPGDFKGRMKILKDYYAAQSGQQG